MKKLFALLLVLALLVPGACAATKDDIKAELGVFRLDELEHVVSINMLPDDDCPKAVLTMEPYMIMGGTEISDDSWFTSEGVMCEADVDLDGDGVKEYVIVYAKMTEGEYPNPELCLRIYARDGEEYALKGDLPLIWYYSNALSESFVRIVPQKNGAVILSCALSQGDGALCYAKVTVYGYDGENCTVPFTAHANNHGDYLAIRDVRHPERLTEYYWMNSWELEENPLDEDYECDPNDDSAEYEEPAIPGPLNADGFECINKNLSRFGIEMQFTTHMSDGWGYVGIDGFSGGRDFQVTYSNDDQNTLTLGMSGSLAEAQMDGLEIWTPSLSDDPWWEIMPDSDTRKLTRDELAHCDSELLGYIRNEILARHGYPFTKEKYQEYFGSKNWYEISEDFSFDDLSQVESANVELIQSLE